MAGGCAPQYQAGAATAAAASTACAQATSAATVAATGTDHQLFSQDPALDSLIDRWLSHKHASTSAPGQVGSNAGGSRSGSNGSAGRRQGEQSQQQQQEQEVLLQQEWEALLGPISVTLTSLETLEEGDDLFALSDSLGHLGASLQELQQLAAQSTHHEQQQQQQQQEEAEGVAAASAAGDTADPAQYTLQLAQLLLTAAESAAVLEDAALINLLAIATVMLTASKHDSSSSSSGSTGDSSSAQAQVQEAAAAAMQAACAELWQRPRVAHRLDAAQLTSLAVVLRRLSSLGAGSSSTLPVLLLLSAYRRLQQLAEALQLSGPQLAVCCWCLSNLPAPPPAKAVAAALRAATAAAAASDGLDSLAVRRLMAACVNWQPHLAARLRQQDDGSPVDLAGAAAEWIQCAAGSVALQLDPNRQFNSSSSRRARSSMSSSSSSTSGDSGSESAWKVAASVAHAAAAYGVSPGDAFVQAVADRLLEGQPAAEAASAGGDAAAAVAARELQPAAAAAGCTLPWWGSLTAEQQQRLPQAITLLDQQQGQEQQQQQQPQQLLLLQSFAAGVAHSFSSAAGSISSDELQLLLDATAEQVLSSSSSSQGSSQGSSQAACIALLLKAMEASSCSAQQLLPLCAAAVDAVRASSVAPVSSASQAAATAAAAAASALCVLQPPGWLQQLQQLTDALTGSGDDGRLQMLPLHAALQLHAAAATAACASPAAAGLAAAVLQQLLTPAALVEASAQEAAQLLVLLSVGRPPWNIAAGQQLQPAPQIGLSSVSSIIGSSTGDGPPPALLLQEQCLRCMRAVIQDSGRSLLPDQLVPVLAAVAFLQQTQQQQQQQWFGAMQGQALSAYLQLHREVLAAVTLQLQDCAGLLAPRDLAWSARLLAIMGARPVLALSAVVQAAGVWAQQMRQQDRVWMLWGLTKLGYTGEPRLQRRLLFAALQAAAVQTPSSDSSRIGEQPRQPQQQDAVGDANSSSGSSGMEELDSAVALLWVAASRVCREPVAVQLLAQVAHHPAAPRPSQVASVVWSLTRLAQLGLPHQQQLLQQRQAVLGMVEGVLGISGTEQELLRPRDIAVLAWGMHRLGHKPSSSAAATLVAATLQHIQQVGSRPSHSSSSINSSSLDGESAGFLPGELSCLLYSLAKWGVQLQGQQLQQLEHFVQQQLSQDLTTVGRESAAVLPAAAAADGSSSSSVHWDGPAVCSSCWALAQLGATLQPSTLAAAEQYLIRLMPDSASIPAALTAAAAAAEQKQPGPGKASSTLQGAQRQQALPPPPSASDFVLFGIACRAAGYQPWQLLQQFRGWVLMQLAQKGPAGLLALQSRATNRQTTAVGANILPPTAGEASTAAPTVAAAAAAGAGAQQQRRRVKGQHAHILVSVLLFLRQAGYADPALLQQLEAASVMEPVVHQLQGRQLVILLSSFCQLGYVPSLWLSRASIRRIGRLVAAAAGAGSSPADSSSGSSQRAGSGSSSPDSSEGGRASSSGDHTPPRLSSSLAAQDCVELIECLAAWHAQPGVSDNTLLRDSILPGLAQLLLKTGQQPSRAAARAQVPMAVAAASSSTSSSIDGAGAAQAAVVTSVPAGSAGGSRSNEGGRDSSRSSGSDESAVNNGSSSGSGGGASQPVSSMPGWQVVSLMRSVCSPMVLLGLSGRSGKPFQQLQQQLLRRLQQVWPELGPAGQVAAAHAAGKCGYDVTGLLKVQQLLPPQPQASQESTSSSSSSPDWDFASAKAASRLLWVFGNVARHPGPQLLAAALQRVAAAATAAQDAGLPLPLWEVSTALYAAAVLQELQHPGATALAQLLQQAAEDRELLGQPQLQQHSEQLVACLLAAQDAAQAAGGGTPPPAPIASFHDADQASAAAAVGSGSSSRGPEAAGAVAGVSSPLLALPAAVQQLLLETRRRKVLRKAARTQGSGEHKQLLLSLRQLGLRGRAKAVTDDGLVCIDVAITTPSGDRIAVELLGPHNAAVNTQRPLAPARLKWRLLASRGYRVVVVNTWQWRTLDSGGMGRGSRDGASSSSPSSSSSVSGVDSSIEEYGGSVMSEKLMYLQARLQAALGPAGAAALSAASRAARPLPREIAAAGGQGRGVPPRRLFGAEVDAAAQPRERPAPRP